MNLTHVSTVAFGPTAASGLTVGSDTSITALSPHGAGTVDVTVSSPGGESAASPADRFTYVPKGPRPQVTSVSPNAGPAAGGTSVTIVGSGFLGVTAVRFAGVPAATFATESASSLTAVSPAAAAGPADVTVTTPNGTSATSLNDRFKFGPPTVTSVSPTSGPASGGATVTITGTGFALGAATTVHFGSTLATGVECSAITTCTAVAPAHKAGSVDIKAAVAGQGSPQSSADRFTYN
jgi:hypothetical protein